MSRREKFWDQAYFQESKHGFSPERSGKAADEALAERDKRFPPPKPPVMLYKGKPVSKDNPLPEDAVVREMLSRHPITLTGHEQL